MLYVGGGGEGKESASGEAGGKGDGSCWAGEGGECVYVQVFPHKRLFTRLEGFNHKYVLYSG